MTAAKNPSMFHTVLAAELEPERDVFVGLPVETTNKQTFHRVPIRSACTDGLSGDRRLRVQFVDGNRNVVQNCAGLQRLLIRFPNAFIPGIRVWRPATTPIAPTSAWASPCTTTARGPRPRRRPCCRTSTPTPG